MQSLVHFQSEPSKPRGSGFKSLDSEKQLVEDRRAPWRRYCIRARSLLGALTCALSQSHSARLLVCTTWQGRFHTNTKFLAQATTEEEYTKVDTAVVGEDAAVFDFGSQKLTSWAYFTLILGLVSVVLYVAWIDPNTGYGAAYVNLLASFSSNPEVVIIAMLSVFALVHSGLASLREEGEKVIGARAYRVLFAGLSLPLAYSAVAYFISHRYEGIQLWNLQHIPGIHQLVWLLSFTSFFFLYPSTFNLLEVAAVDKPKVHMWETGIMRITRHPQMVGQVMWCLAHTLWIGNSMALTTSVGLVAHHVFGVWHGDKRLASRYGEAFQAVKRRTSVVPFLAILQGRQRLPAGYYKEFLRLPYVLVTLLTLAAYFAHPLLYSSSS